MRWLLIGYMFLFIDRPFEVWPWLGDLHVERVYMLVTMAAWAVYPNKRFLPNAQHAAYAAFATAVVACWAVSPYAEKGQPLVEDWLKILVFYVLLVTTVHDEKGLREIAIGFILVMGVYLAHSFREYLGGRHTFRMGIARMIGVDTSLGDPNAFGASIVYVLPFVAALWRAEVWGRTGKFLLTAYVGLSCLCVLLTGSRGSLLGLLVWFAILILGHPRRFTFLALFLCAAPLAFVALPQSLQTRFETIIDPSVGPKNAQESGQGRLEGFVKGFELWAGNPLAGVGPGAWRPATGSKVESHNLYGQLVGEMGAAGLVTFAGVVACFWMNWRAVRRVRREYPEWRNDLVVQIPAAVATSVFLLLFLGNFAHNLFRFTWLWYGGFLIIARHCIARRVAEWEPEAAEDAEAGDAEEAPEGWTAHPPHAAGYTQPFGAG
jgi:O-antigen ligase